MVDWWKKVVFDNYANFEGRARRSEYWYYVLMNALLGVGLFVLGAVFAGMEIGILSGLFILAYVVLAVGTLIPSLAVAVRRLHDGNYSGWFLLMGFIPIANIVLIVFLATEGTRGPNKYGPDPKGLLDDNLTDHLVD